MSIEPTCVHPGCDGQVYAKKLCKLHYGRQNRGIAMDMPLPRVGEDLVAVNLRLTRQSVTYVEAYAAVHNTTAYMLLREIVEEWVRTKENLSS